MNDSTTVLRLKKNEEKRLTSGHLWIYSNEIDTHISPLNQLNPGQAVELHSSTGKWLAHAYANPHSLICARITSRDPKYPMNKSLLIHRLKVALSLRERFYPEPFYRLVFGESDLLPGLVVDRFGDVLVVQISTAGMEVLKEEIVAALDKVVQPVGMILRCNSGSRKLEGLSNYTEKVGELPDETVLREGGTEFVVPIANGQKTGWFYDQHDNRQWLNPLVKDKTVIDACSYIGAWGVQTASHGAKRVICIDTSESALEYVAENAQRNGVSDRVFTVQGNATEVLAGLKADGENADVVVLDPPAFIKRKKDFRNGFRGYQKLNERGISLVKPDGIIATCSCSHHMPAKDFLTMVNRAAVHVDRQLQILAEMGQSRDHPIHPAMPETRYLKTTFARVLPRN
ncbi:MAG: class I SAM-dependent rRNA methyltransferase [Proteobacteria bacterium]|jgi:23S rRNA (cytosine1962-C5)-methyltransferase|nr:class I SAM-dependent rRNA methyltransferase [Pseudomonadota bacterium]